MLQLCFKPVLYFTSVFALSFVTAVGSKPQCFSQPAPGHSRARLVPAELNDCIFMSQLLLKGDKAHAPMHWSRDKRLGWKLPTMWDVWGSSCFVTMDMLPEYDDDMVVFAMDAVAHVVVDIINWCQTSEQLPHLGGREVVGPEAKTIVILAGKVPEKGPKPPGWPHLQMSSPVFNLTHGSSGPGQRGLARARQYDRS
ncbi:MAG: hypothetical protein Q9223_006977 [Gallowayella weberi]